MIFLFPRCISSMHTCTSKIKGDATLPSHLIDYSCYGVTRILLEDFTYQLPHGEDDLAPSLSHMNWTGDMELESCSFA